MAQVMRPGGGTESVALRWTGERDGEYRGTFVTAEPGSYEVTVDALRAGKAAGSAVGYVRAAPGETARQLVERVSRSVEEFTAGAAPADDITLVALRYCGSPDGSRVDAS